MYTKKQAIFLRVFLQIISRLELMNESTYKEVYVKARDLHFAVLAAAEARGKIDTKLSPGPAARAAAEKKNQ
jgi:hypothetical protein